MALKTKKGKELPEGAVEVSEKEALKYQQNFIKNWPSEWEVFSIKFGKDIAAATTCLSSVYISHYFKRVLFVNNTRFILALTPGVIIPSFFSRAITDNIVTNSTILMKQSCPICKQLQFMCTQLYLGVVFPTLYGYLSLSTFAGMSGSYPIPRIQTHGKEFWRVTFHILKQGIPHMQLIGLVNTILILFLPYAQNKQMYNVMVKAQQKEMAEADSELL